MANNGHIERQISDSRAAVSGRLLSFVDAIPCAIAAKEYLVVQTTAIELLNKTSVDY